MNPQLRALIAAPLALAMLFFQSAPERRDYKVFQHKTSAQVPTPGASYSHLYIDGGTAKIDQSDGTTDTLATADSSMPTLAEGIYLREEFLSGKATSSNDHATGQLGWQVLSSAAIVLGANSRAGTVRVGNNAATGTQAVIMLNPTDCCAASGWLNPELFFDATFIFQTPVTITNRGYWVGFLNAWGNTVSAGIFLTRTTGAGNFEFETRSSNTVGDSTTTDSGVAPVVDGWNKLRIRRIDASTIGFTLNGGAEVQHTTDIPTAVLSPGFAAWQTSAGSVSYVTADAFEMRITGLTR
jgi:hypothetical protein